MCYYYYSFLNIILLLLLLLLLHHHHYHHHHRHLGKTLYLRMPQGFLSTLELSEMNSKYDTVTMFLSVSVINNISNQNLQKCL